MVNKAEGISEDLSETKLRQHWINRFIRLSRETYTHVIKRIQGVRKTGLRQQNAQREFVITVQTEQIPSVYGVWSVIIFLHKLMLHAVSWNDNCQEIPQHSGSPKFHSRRYMNPP
jgi:hypothetical protein